MKNPERTSLTPVERLIGEDRKKEKIPLAIETRLEIRINGASLVSMQCLPGNEKELAVGFLASEGLVNGSNMIEAVDVDTEEGIVDITAAMDPDKLRSLLQKASISSGCGRGITIDNIDEVMDCDKKINMAFTVSRREISELMKQFQSLPSLYPETHCVHLAALAQNGKILFYAEDIGRHNAVDKTFGRALLEGIPLQDKILLSTGRLTFEVAAKAVRQRMPVLLSRTSPSSAAVTLARKFHMGLVGSIRGTRMNIFSAGWRVT